MRTRYRKRAGRFNFNNSFRPGSSRSRFVRSNPLWAVRSLAACKAQEVCSQWCTHILYILSLVLRKGPGSAITLRRTGAFSFVILRPPTVPARILRIAVQWRKTSFGNRSDDGEVATARLPTVTQEYLTEAVRCYRSGQRVPSLLAQQI